MKVGGWYAGMAWRSLGAEGRGVGFWFRVCGYGLAWNVVRPGCYRILSERYAGQHGFPRRYIVYVPVGFGRRWRIEVLTPRRSSKSTTRPVK